MKVNIGPYKNWFGPYQLAELLCFWVKEKEDEYGNYVKPEWVTKFGDFLAHGFSPDESDKPKSKRIFKERPTTWLYKLLLWIHSKKERKVKVSIDCYDTWNMYETLAVIILPMLKQLQLTKHGSPHVDDDDVPAYLRSTAAPPKDEYDIDVFHHDRWEWVLSEMIWTFEQLQPDTDWMAQYVSGESDIYFEACDFDKDGKPKLYRMERGESDTYKMDEVAIQAHQNRINRGCVLFGKYFQNLWD